MSRGHHYIPEDQAVRGLCPHCLKPITAPEFYEWQDVELPCGCKQEKPKPSDDIPF